jgi:hypothetical protein
MRRFRITVGVFVCVTSFTALGKCDDQPQTITVSDIGDFLLPNY